MKGNKPSSKALEMVKIAFHRACRYDKFITLHIDDGRMGGGGSIPHDDLSHRDIEKKYHDNSAYFSPNRHHIFHYCVFAHKNQDHSDTVTGWGEYSGDFFVVYDGTLGGNSFYQANTFMHELGHNILGPYIKFSNPAWAGVDPETKYSWYNPKLTHFITGRYTNFPTGKDLDGDGKNDVYDHSSDPGDTMYHITTRTTINYKPETWAAIDLVESLN